VIVLDTHVWVWWVHGDPQLSRTQLLAIRAAEGETIGVCAISCWEVAKLVERGRLELPCALDVWLQQALVYPGVALLPLTPPIAIASTRLPPPFPRDLADQLIAATAQVYDCPLVTSDLRIVGSGCLRTIR